MVLIEVITTQTETKMVKTMEGPTFLQFFFQTSLKQLTDMGFKETRAKKALILNRLVNFCLCSNKSIP